ncbi:MAG TPA: DUF2304 domain-containing protein [Phycisphaerae bacterium]|nr:DUF2304 domain-containing protein [Phycisphaerae bacterium]
MNWFQLLVLVVLVLALLVTLAATVRGWATRREAIVWAVICLAVAAATLEPERLIVPIARALGIGRGADLVFYTVAVVMLIGFWMTYIRLRFLRRQITLLVRQLALMEGKREYGDR